MPHRRAGPGARRDRPQLAGGAVAEGQGSRGGTGRGNANTNTESEISAY